MHLRLHTDTHGKFWPGIAFPQAESRSTIRVPRGIGAQYLFSGGNERYDVSSNSYTPGEFKLENSESTAAEKADDHLG